MSEPIKTKADKSIEDCLKNKQCFSMIAGAGSGKTTSLITSLQYLKRAEGDILRRDDKKIVCITYTNRAVEVISDRLEQDSLFYISTLNKFLWNEINNFTSNIRTVLKDYIIPNLIEKKREEDNGGQSQRAISARNKIDTLEKNIIAIDDVEYFSYNDANFSDYGKGQLNHDDVINVAAQLITENKTLRDIMGQKYPYIMVDEAQDTFDNVVIALNKICEKKGLPVVGYFGDPMQQIYDKRAGNFEGPENSVIITKEENFRSSISVIKFLNAFRKDVQQYPAGKNAKVEGSVNIKLIQAEVPAEARNRYSEEQIERASVKFTKAVEDWGWEDCKEVKWLFLVRQMIARRLGFPEMQKLFTGIYASSKAQEDYEKGDHFLLKPFIDMLFPLVQAQRSKRPRQVLAILRKSSPAFDPIGVNEKNTIKEMIDRALDITTALSALWDKGTLKEILIYCRTNNLYHFSDKLSEYLDSKPRDDAYNPEQHEIDKGDWLVDIFFKMSSKEIETYFDFINKNTPLSTQHGVKGEQYKNVLVVFDDFEAAWHNYSFTKTLIPKTSGDPTEGQYNRSQKLAYVCFSRAEENLRILLFTSNPEEGKNELISEGLFTKDQISIAS